jgi:hypothetical protein
MSTVRRMAAEVPEEQLRQALDAAMVAWEHFRDPYDLAVWVHVAMCCILSGACEHSIPETAEFCRMSVGKAQEVRKYLIEQGVIVGGSVDEEGQKGRPRWRLSIKYSLEGNQE